MYIFASLYDFHCGHLRVHRTVASSFRTFPLYFERSDIGIIINNSESCDRPIDFFTQRTMIKTTVAIHFIYNLNIKGRSRKFGIAIVGIDISINL